MKKFVMMLSMVASFFFASMAFAITLDEAKAQGLVGEKVDGYVAAVIANPTAEIEALIKTTNDGRRQVYADLAQRNNITIDAVGIVSAEKLREKAARGEYVQSTSGQWEKK
ncbi:MAG: YdbL family protein [Pseudomonadota bacterium]